MISWLIASSLALMYALRILYLSGWIAVWRPVSLPGSNDLQILIDGLNTVAILALVLLAVLLFLAAIKSRTQSPFHASASRLWFYQILIGIPMLLFLVSLLLAPASPPVAALDINRDQWDENQVVWPLFLALSSTTGLIWLTALWFSRSGKLSDRIGNIVFAFCISLLVAEGALRLAGQLWSHPLMIPSDPSAEARINTWRLQPGSTWMGKRVNSQGYCDDEHGQKKETDVFRIVILADSFGVGYVPYQSNFISLMREQLREDKLATRHYEVINLAVPSAGPAEYQWLLLHEALQFSPDLIICCFFVGNDFLDSQSRGINLLDVESYATARFLKRLFVLYHYRRRAEASLVDHGGPAFSKEDYLKLESARLKTCFRPGSTAMYAAALHYLQQIFALASNKIMLFVIPDEFQVNDSLYAQLLRGNPLRHLYERDSPNHILQDYCKQYEVPYVDPLPALRASQKSTYLLRDSHWNEKGNKIAADVLTKAIKEWQQKESHDE